MPIRKERMALYPGGSIRSPEWLYIRATTLFEAGNHCVGSPAYPACRAANGKPHPRTGSKVVLTIAHLNHEEADCRPENLRAWCQLCHLTYDAARKTAERKEHLAEIGKLQNPQLPF